MQWSVCARGIVTALVLGALAVHPVSAQITTGTVAGSVKDDQGLAVPGASVTLISEARGTRMAPVVTNATGDFVVPNVTPDTYTVEIAMPGFSSVVRPGVAVSGGDRISVGALTLSVGGTSETVTVKSEAPLIQSQSGERSFSVTTAEVENLPISARNFAAFTALTPGVVGTTTRLGGGGQNNIMMDGVSTMDTGNNGQLLQMNPEAISEVKVLTAGYQAEYGRSSGLQITAVTKSGTNRFRGSVYDVMRNSDWNSNSWVNKINGTPKAVDKQSDWGYTLGGPVGKPGAANKLFFFYSHEYRPRNAANTLRQFRVPTQAERNGDFSASLDNNGAPIPTLRDAVGAGHHRQPDSSGAALSGRCEHPEALSAAEHHAGGGHVLQPGVPLADVQDPQPAAGIPRRLPAVVGAAVHGEVHRPARLQGHDAGDDCPTSTTPTTPTRGSMPLRPR